MRISGWTPILIGLALMWALTLVQLSGDWEVYIQYNFGWLVPLLAAYLAWRRWPDRPTPEPGPRPGAWALGAGALLLAPWLLLWLLREANPDWRLIGWAMGLLAVAATLVVLGWAGGRPWVRHFGFPAALILIAIPWPTGVEQAVIQGMTRAVTAFTVEALVWSGSFAVQSGNVILLANGALGVDEACSGVRSFQSNLMAALVVGELYRFGAGRRFLLLAAGLLAGFLLNLVRAFILATIAARGEVADVGVWHDPAGYTILLVSFGLLLLCARVLRGRGAEDAEPPAAAVSAPPAPPWAPRAWAAAAVLLLVVPASEAWYRAHEREGGAMAAWHLDWTGLPGVTSRPIPDKVRSILRYSAAESTLWPGPGTGPWYFYEISWEPGRVSAQMARSHTPDICLPAAGAQSAGVGEVVFHDLGPVRLPIQPYTFRVGADTVHVFFSLWEQHPPGEGNGAGSAYDPAGRLRAVWEGRRNRGQKVLHATLTGFPDRGEALAAYRRFLDAHLRVDEAAP
jgi:exosortase